MDVLMSEIQGESPAFPILVNKISFLDSPKEFYEYILSSVNNAQERIYISSLYIGNDQLSQKLIHLLDKNLSSKPNLKLFLILDQNRSLRNQDSSLKSDLIPLQKKFGDQKVSIICYKNFMSEKLCKLFKINSSKLGEILGVHHMKFLIFDNTLLLTGANLNGTYFQNRIDRYIAIKEANELCKYLIEIHNSLSLVYKKISEHSIITPNESSASIFFPASNSMLIEAKPEYAYIIPCLQMNPFGIFQDAIVFKKLLSKIASEFPDTEINFLTSYFNPTSDLENFMVDASLKWRVLTSAPEANSFHSAKGVARHIPSFYQNILHDLLRKSKSRLNNIKAFEFFRRGETFHAKGIYVRFRDGSSLSTIGSPNFGSRSEFLDNELQFYIFSKNLDFNQKLHTVPSQLS